MSVERPGKTRIPYASRPENQEVKLTRKTYIELIERLDSLERKIAELTNHTHEYRAPGPLRPVTSRTKPPTAGEPDQPDNAS
jgi:hypothetical protein